jgi:hypothetical protein
MVAPLTDRLVDIRYMCAVCSMETKRVVKKRRRPPRRLIAEARGSLACAANSKCCYATGNHRIGDGAQRCRGARLRLVTAL